MRLSVPLALALVVAAAAPLPVHAEAIWAELDRPRSQERIREPVGLLEVRGWAGTGMRGQHDVIIALDRTASTFEPSGSDVDGDGHVGKRIRIERGVEIISDPDDTIQAAQLLAARQLIQRLDSTSTRMGIVTFARTEKVLARVGTPRDDLLAALDGLPPRPGRGGTYFYGAIIASLKVFEQAPPSGGRRHQSIIFLSDGLPNRPSPPAFAAKAAVRASQHAAKANVRIYSFALGPEVASHPQVFLDMAEANRGELLIVENPGDIIYFVPHMSLTSLSKVEIKNVTTGKKGRAVRLFPDGTFDGYVTLAEGENLLLVTIYGEGGGTKTVERKVVFEKTAGDTDAARRRLEQLLAKIRERTLETQLAEEARLKRKQALARQLEIRVEDENKVETP